MLGKRSVEKAWPTRRIARCSRFKSPPLSGLLGVYSLRIPQPGAGEHRLVRLMVRAVTAKLPGRAAAAK